MHQRFTKCSLVFDFDRTYDLLVPWKKINNGGRISKYHQYLVLSLVKNIFVLFENKKKSVYYTYGIFK